MTRRQIKAPQIQRSDRVFIVGTTGSGKSELTHAMLCQSPRQIVIWDAKHEITIPGVDPVYKLERVHLKRDRVIVFRPSEKGGEDKSNTGEMARLCRMIWNHCPPHRHGLIFWIDETDGPSSESQCPDPLNALLKKGRTRNITVIAITQRPVRVWKAFKSEAAHIMVMAQTWGDDDARSLAGEMQLPKPGAATLNAWIEHAAETHRTSDDAEHDVGRFAYLHWHRPNRSTVIRPPLPAHMRKPWPDEKTRWKTQTNSPAA